MRISRSGSVFLVEEQTAIYVLQSHSLIKGRERLLVVHERFHAAAEPGLLPGFPIHNPDAGTYEKQCWQCCLWNRTSFV